MALPFGIDETGTIGCCDAFSCQIKTACVDYSAYQNNDLCNSSCRDDEMMLKWSVYFIVSIESSSFSLWLYTLNALLIPRSIRKNKAFSYFHAARKLRPR